MPALSTTAAFQEPRGWTIGAIREILARGSWRGVVHDPELDCLDGRGEVYNRNVLVTTPGCNEVKALFRESQASFFPNVTLEFNSRGACLAARAAGASRVVIGSPTSSAAHNPLRILPLSLDDGGKIRQQVRSKVADPQAKAADFANAKLSAQRRLAIPYFNMRANVLPRAPWEENLAECERTREITEIQQASGIVSKTNAVGAGTQLLRAISRTKNPVVAPAENEPTIAILTGTPTAELKLPHQTLSPNTPTALRAAPAPRLGRRRDLAAAERQIQQQSALIDIAAAAENPDISLDGFGVFTVGHGLLLQTAYRTCSLGLAKSDQLFDGGMHEPGMDSARASIWRGVAYHRGTRLTAFQQFQDQITAIRIQRGQLQAREKAVKGTREPIEIHLDQPRAGAMSFNTAVT
jgi:outer membrane protein TolC